MRQKLVAHMRDGEIVKGYSGDFGTDPSFDDTENPSFHLFSLQKPVASSRRIDLDELKALFFVRTWGRPPGLVLRNYEFEEAELGRKATVRFLDGERIWGYVLEEPAPGDGFYLVPANPEDNNIKIFVVNSAVGELSYLDLQVSTSH